MNATEMNKYVWLYKTFQQRRYFDDCPVELQNPEESGYMKTASITKTEALIFFNYIKSIRQWIVLQFHIR